MQVHGRFRPPPIGMRVEPYPISGPGALAITNGALHASGNRGIPWQVQVGGLVGLFAGCLLIWFVLRHLGTTLTLVGLMGCISAGAAIGYRFGGGRLRARHEVTFAPNAIVDVDSTDAELQITISFRKRWQTRKQCLHFRPDDPAQIGEVCRAVADLRASKAA